MKLDKSFNYSTLFELIKELNTAGFSHDREKTTNI